tara:strand:- start:95 stop:307 length:213 start_codon:yes stop_codon:yes gene_type:complete
MIGLSRATFSCYPNVSMNIFMYLRAEDGVALRDFLKKNPSVKGITKDKEFLDAGLIARVCYSLEVELNKL